MEDVISYMCHSMTTNVSCTLKESSLAQQISLHFFSDLCFDLMYYFLYRVEKILYSMYIFQGYIWILDCFKAIGNLKSYSKLITLILGL